MQLVQRRKDYARAINQVNQHRSRVREQGLADTGSHSTLPQLKRVPFKSPETLVLNSVDDVDADAKLVEAIK